MCTKGVWQLQELVFRYCPMGGSSIGTRKFIREGLVDFAKKNPQVECKVILGKGKHPVVEGRYVWGVNKVVDLRNKEPSEISKQITLLRNSTGHKNVTSQKEIFSKDPSIQGPWQPGVTRDIKFEVKISN